MDTPFEPSRWYPTQTASPGDTAVVPADRDTLRHDLAAQTKDILRHPYDPECWLRRAETLSHLRYPELAMGDAHKALLLCGQHLERLGNEAMGCGWRLGLGMGFWMLESEHDSRELEERLLQLQDRARRLERKYAGAPKESVLKGKFHPRPYPWLAPERGSRDDALVARINHEFAQNARETLGKELFCEVQRNAFGNDTEVLGVFATRDISSGTTILVDQSRVWGCNGPGKGGDLTNLHGGVGCDDPLHPMSPDDDISLDLRWIRDEAGKDASTTLMICRLLLAIHTDGFANPLDHPLAARLTPAYHTKSAPQSFYRHTEFDIPMRALQQFGIDIFANHEFDTWILFTIFARVENNSCGDVMSQSLMPLFGMFNHSCEPNVEWTRNLRGSTETDDSDEKAEVENRWQGEQFVQEGVDHASTVVTTARDIKKGEQLFVEYDSFVHIESVWERRRRLKNWLIGDCMCERCVREEKEKRKQAEMPVREGNGTWDDSEKVELPEERGALKGIKLHHY